MVPLRTSHGIGTGRLLPERQYPVVLKSVTLSLVVVDPATLRSCTLQRGLHRNKANKGANGIAEERGRLLFVLQNVYSFTQFRSLTLQTGGLLLISPSVQQRVTFDRRPSTDNVFVGDLRGVS